mgnify:CR=1 FL=1
MIAKSLSWEKDDVASYFTPSMKDMKVMRVDVYLEEVLRTSILVRDVFATNYHEKIKENFCSKL